MQDLLAFREGLQNGKLRLRDIVADLETEESEEVDKETAYLDRTLAMLEAARGHYRSWHRLRRPLVARKAMSAAQRKPGCTTGGAPPGTFDVVSSMKIHRSRSTSSPSESRVWLREHSRPGTLRNIEERSGTPAAELPQGIQELSQSETRKRSPA